MQKFQKNEVSIRTHIRPGDIGDIIRLHGLIYAKEYGWDYTFEGYVASSFAEFILSADKKRSCLWIIENEGKVIGSIGIVGRKGSDEAQLRWLLILPDYRGKGYGLQLVKKALCFCRSQKFKSVFLWTVNNLEAAAHIYHSVGFQKTEEKTHRIWGKMITEVRHYLSLK